MCSLKFSSLSTNNSTAFNLQLIATICFHVINKELNAEDMVASVINCNGFSYATAAPFS